MKNPLRSSRAIAPRLRGVAYCREHARRAIIRNYKRGLIGRHTMQQQLADHEGR